MGDVIFTDIVDVGGRKFRKQSGSIGETIERSQRRRAAERTRAVRVAAEEEVRAISEFSFTKLDCLFFGERIFWSDDEVEALGG